MSNVNVQVGHIIADEIREKGMTKLAVSEKSGMPYSTLNSKLKGYRSIDMDDILALAEAIDVSPIRFIPSEFFSSADSEAER
jgi:transcriptional regulator with XRE-family HTH domain